MNNILRFKIYIEGLEEKIERTIDIDDNKTVADLAYTILASFDSLAYHLYYIKHNNIYYNCGINMEDIFDNKDRRNATKVFLSKLDFSKNKEMEMVYDYGSPTTFIIKYIGIEKLQEKNSYLKVVEGKGHGMLDDITADELIDIVKKTDKLGYTEDYYTLGYETDEKYDYREYDLAQDNEKLSEKYLQIKKGYENKSEY